MFGLFNKKDIELEIDTIAAMSEATSALRVATAEVKELKKKIDSLEASIRNQQLKKKQNRVGKFIEVRDLKTGMISIYKSQTKAAKVLGVSSSLISRRATAGEVLQGRYKLSILGGDNAGLQIEKTEADNPTV